MIPLKTKRLVTSSIVAAVWLSLIGFFVLKVLPIVQSDVALYGEVARADQMLQKRLKGSVIPSKGLIDQYEQLKSGYQEEASACAYFFYREHNEKLDRPILKSYLMDPIQFGNNYREWKERMADKAGNPNVFPPYPWEQPGSKPAVKDFAAIEKRTCIADVLVGILTVERSTIVKLVEIYDPVGPVDVSPAPVADWDVARFHIYPVEVSLTTRFTHIGRMFDLFVNNPTERTLPCMVIRSLRVTQTEENDPDTVNVRMTVDVYDFRKVEPEEEPET